MLFERIVRHARLSLRGLTPGRRKTPPFMVVFINSICNLTCEHCFYWKNLNRRDDLAFEEFRKLSLELGPFENLNLSGGEPFLRTDFAEVCTLFIRNNRVKQIYVPTNGYYTDKTAAQVDKVMQSPGLQLLVLELSLDGTADYHDRFRGNPRSFARAMETYDRLAQMQKQDRRIRIHATSTATNENLDELRRLTAYLHQRCPAMDHHSLAIIHGDPKNPALQSPDLRLYQELYADMAAIWHDREKGRLGAIVEPMLQWAKGNILRRGKQDVPCGAGRLTGVVHANGDVAVCELHAPLGNLRQKSFFEIWDSREARELRARIRSGACHCTKEVWLWPSIVYQPWQLARALLGVRFWRAWLPKRPGQGNTRVSLPVVAGGQEPPARQAG